MADSLEARIAEQVVGALEGGNPVLVATVMAAPDGQGEHVGAKLLVRTDGSTLGSLGVAALDSVVTAGAGEAFRRHRVHTLYLSSAGKEQSRREAAGEAFQVMVEVHEQSCALVIAGGGHVGKALSEIASLCGFRVTVIDDRPEYADPERFPEAERVIRGRFDEVLADYPLDSTTYVVAVTRGHKHDEASLRGVIGRGAAYVGMIGSRRRAKAVLKHLVEDGADPEEVAKVHTPIGLDIGAESPAEIAVSVMAEIILLRRGGHGRPLSEGRGE
ncbi:MAG: XdhC family protein [Chloroflexi bacterium]|nr:XdhC family protein [Chloroflexota bacterium]